MLITVGHWLGFRPGAPSVKFDEGEGSPSASRSHMRDSLFETFCYTLLRPASKVDSVFCEPLGTCRSADVGLGFRLWSQVPRTVTGVLRFSGLCRMPPSKATILPVSLCRIYGKSVSGCQSNRHQNLSFLLSVRQQATPKDTTQPLGTTRSVRIFRRFCVELMA